MLNLHLLFGNMMSFSFRSFANFSFDSENGNHKIISLAHQITILELHNHLYPY